MTAPLRIVLASANPDKTVEMRSILGHELGDRIELVARPATVPPVEESGATLLDNARLKARALVEATGLAAVADDTGLEVDALAGAPGVFSARYAGEHASYADNVDKLLHALQGGTARSARFRTVALLSFPSGLEIVGEGTIDGSIAMERRGLAGFGYDPIFVPIGGHGATFSELTVQEKDAISHRGRALRALAVALGEHLRATGHTR